MENFVKKIRSLHSKDVVIVFLIFAFVLVCTSLTQIDETPYEATISAVGGVAVTIGFLLEIPVNFPIINVIHVINTLSGGDLGSYPISYDAYFQILPWITAAVYSIVAFFYLSRKTT